MAETMEEAPRARREKAAVKCILIDWGELSRLTFYIIEKKKLRGFAIGLLLSDE